MSPAVAEPGPWWRDWQVAALVLLVVVAYFLRAGEVPIRGEEPTRATIAFEMVERGDLLVPCAQGEPFRIRPPFQNWVIAASCLAFGSWDAWAVRFPSPVATLLTTLLVYGYCRSFLPRLGSFAAGLVLATLADMFQMGRQAETEALFILLVSASLLTWHWGFLRRWPDALTYALGYGFMALAMLTKGLQAPVYFLGSISAYFVLTGQWRRLFCRGHLLGALVGASILLAWLIPYSLAMGWSEVVSIWLGDPAVGDSVRHWDAGKLATHLLSYPAEIAAGTLPWCLLLLAYWDRGLRRSLGEARPSVLFMATSLAVAFPTCWLHPGGQPRFFAPLFPCLAVLIGLAIQRCAEVDAAAKLRAFWRCFLGTVSGAMLVAAAAVVVMAMWRPHGPLLAAWVEPPLVALAYALASVGLAVVVWRAGREDGIARAQQAVLGIACFMAITFAGVVTDVRVRRSENAAAAIRHIKEQLPHGQALVSLGGRVNSLFLYYFGRPTITMQPWPAGDPGPDLTYFCFECRSESPPALPFRWEEIGTVSVVRVHQATPGQVVVVGRRLPPSSSIAASEDSGPDH